MANKLIRYKMSIERNSIPSIVKTWSDKVTSFSNISRDVEYNPLTVNYYAYFNNATLLLSADSSVGFYFGTRRSTDSGRNFTGVKQPMMSYGNTIFYETYGDFYCEFVVDDETNALIAATAVRNGALTNLYTLSLLLLNDGTDIKLIRGMAVNTQNGIITTYEPGSATQYIVLLEPRDCFFLDLRAYGYASTGDDTVYIRDTFYRDTSESPSISHIFGEDVKMIVGKQITGYEVSGGAQCYYGFAKTIEVDDKKYMNLGGLWIGYDSEEEESVTV